MIEKNLNVWDEKVAKRLQIDWNKALPFYTEEVFKMVERIGHDYIDLGCGTGRFLNWLSKVKPGMFHYIGFDNSEEMLNLIDNSLITASVRIKKQNITEHIGKFEDFVLLCHEIMIHLNHEDQVKVLRVINDSKVKHSIITFQTNSKIHSSLSTIVSLENSQFINMVQTYTDIFTMIEKYMTDYVVTDDMSFHLTDDVQKFVVKLSRKSHKLEK